MEQDKNLTVAANYDQLPESLQRFYDAFKEATPGYYDKENYTGGLGFGINDAQIGPVNITVDNVLLSVVDTEEYVASQDKYMKFIVLQGYAQLSIFDRFYASCILTGKAEKTSLISVVDLVDHITKTADEREELRQKEIDAVKMNPSFYASVHNDPIHEAESTYGVYVIYDKSRQEISCDTVLQAMGVADFADNTFFGLAIGVRANINTFKKSMDFAVAGSVRFAGSERFTVVGELGLLNGKINAISLSVRAVIPIATEVFMTQAQFSIRGFQESKIGVGFGGGLAFGQKMRIPEGLGIVKKALFPNLTSFYPLELTANCEINPAQSYGALSGTGLLMGNLAISGKVVYDDGDIDAELRAGTVRNKYLNGSLEVAYHKRQDNWNLRASFDCSICVDWKNIVGVTVSGGAGILFTSQDYTLNNATYNRKDLTITVSGMGKVKIGFTFSVSVQKTWIFNLSNQRLSKSLLRAGSNPDIGTDQAADNDVMICESEDIAEISTPQFSIRSGVIDVKSWQVDAQNSSSGLVKFQVAAQYTLADSSWRLTHASGENITVYTAENSAGTVLLNEFGHNYYELTIDTPAMGSWTLEILGDKKISGALYMDALSDEKIVADLKILEKSDSAIKFGYSAHTRSGSDKLMVRLWAEEIAAENTSEAFSGVIAYLEETEAGEFIWQIPENFCNNANYRFYISAASTEAAAIKDSDFVEVELKRQKAKLDCDWELVYDANNTNTVTAYITITNSGAESTVCQWKLLDYTNNDSIESDDVDVGNIVHAAEVIASGECAEIAGNSTITYQHVITITDELRDNPSALQLSVTQCKANDMVNSDGGTVVEENYADDTDEITFAAMNSMYCQKKTVSWQAVEGAAFYVLQYALEGDWEEGGVYINNITGTSCTLSLAPGEYCYRVMAMDSNNESLGTWSEAAELDVKFVSEQLIDVSGNCRKSREQIFTLNDGIYNLSALSMANFTGTLVLYRNNLIENGENNNNTSVKLKEKKILSLKFVDGKLLNPVSDMLLDHGDYFWEWNRKGGNINSTSEITVKISGDVFSEEQSDREYTTIGGKDSDLPEDAYGNNIETIKGEVGFCNKDAIYKYMTNNGGELTLAIQSGTVFGADLKLYVYVQDDNSDKYSRVKSVTVKAGEYVDNRVILDKLAVKNNFYIQIVSWDKGKGKYNTDYSFDLSFDAFEDSTQTTDVIEIDGDPVTEWIGYRNDAHRYLLQVDEKDLYAVRLQGDDAEAVLKICNLNGKVIKKEKIAADGTAFIDGICLESGKYFVEVEAKDKGKGKYNTDYTLSVSRLQTLYPKIDNSNDTIAKASLQEAIAVGEKVEDWLGVGDEVDFFKIMLGYREDDTSVLAVNLDEKTTRAVDDGILKFTCCTESGKNLALMEIKPGQLAVKNFCSETELYIGVSLKKASDDVDYAFDTSLLAISN